MGYRLRLGKIAKTERDKFKNCNTAEEAEQVLIESGDEDAALYRPSAHIQLHEIGKYVDYSEHAHEDFYNFELDDVEFKIVGRDFLIYLIEEYRKNTTEYYLELYTRAKLGDTSVARDLENKYNEWNNHSGFLNIFNYDSDKTEDKLTSSWKYEYNVFNLLHILHTFDWENDYLIYSGW